MTNTELLLTTLENPVISSGGLTLREIRNADDSVRAYAMNVDLRVEMPLGLSGELVVDVDVLDNDCDYFLAPITFMVTPTMTSCEVMRIIANELATYGVMDTFELAHLHFEVTPPGVLHLSDVAFYVRGVLTEEEFDRMPPERTM